MHILNLQPEPFQRQDSFEATLAEMLSMPLNNTDFQNMSMPAPLSANMTLDNTTADTPLLQNTTMTPPMNTTDFTNTFSKCHIGVLSCGVIA